MLPLHMSKPPKHNPLSWFFGTLAAFVSLLLLVNCSSRGGRLQARMPDHVLMKPDSPEDINRNTDSVTLRATDMYEAGKFRRFLHGRKYRDAWAAPITVPVGWLDTLKGGLTPDDKGGGFQTLSLDLIDTAGVVYTIRTINKDPIKFIKPWMGLFGVDNLVIDGIAAGHPYGAQVLPALSDAAGIKHFNPKLYFIPKQAALGNYNEDFGNKLFWLEYEPEGKVPKFVGIKTAEDYDDSEKVLEKWKNDPDNNTPNLRALVRARIFDLWLGDWDRHDGQWGWVQYQDGDKNSYYPIPMDRDNVFYGINGFFPNIVRQFEKRLQPFGEEIKSMDGLTSNSAYFDYSFLHGVDEEVFREEAKSLQNALTDEVIERGMRSWPESVYQHDGERIVEALKQRREDLVKYALKFHKVIQKRGVVEDREDEE